MSHLFVNVNVLLLHKRWFLQNKMELPRPNHVLQMYPFMMSPMGRVHHCY